MQFRVRKLTENDLSVIEDMATRKFDVTNTSATIFQDTSAKNVFRHFVLPDHVAGSNRYLSFGCFDENENLLGLIGIRCMDEKPSWLLSFIVTSSDCSPTVGIKIILNLLNYAVDYQEKKGYFQWFVSSKAEKFHAWQKLFLGLRKRYHHYVYGHVPAGELPKWLGTMELTGNKVFPYDINISMYIRKDFCTNAEDLPGIIDSDIEFL
jgi:hypothetical protein